MAAYPELFNLGLKNFGIPISFTIFYKSGTKMKMSSKIKQPLLDMKLQIDCDRND